MPVGTCRPRCRLSVLKSFGWSLAAFVLVTFGGAAADSTPTAAGDPVLARAVMSEALQAFAPVNEGVVFSAAQGSILCFTEFDPVPTEAVIYHEWYRRDHPIATHKLHLKPPRWSTVSTVQLREADKGPWRVDIKLESGKLLRTLRFSVID